MSNAARRMKRTKKILDRKEYYRSMRQRRNEKYPCPYNQTLCGEMSCKGCGVYEEINQK